METLVDMFGEMIMGPVDALEKEVVTVPVVEAPVAEVVPVAATTGFADQPQTPGGNYSSNTERLNAYAHANKVDVFVPTGVKTMTVSLVKDVITNGRNIVLYVATEKDSNNRHCGGRILGADL